MGKNPFDMVGSFMAGAAKAAADTAGGAVNAAAKAAGDAANAAGKAAHDAGKVAGHVANAAGKAIGDAANAVTKTASNVAEDAFTSFGARRARHMLRPSRTTGVHIWRQVLLLMRRR